MRKFMPVTIRMAKEQNLFLNPTKISGICGRLLCCLSFEQENYEQFHKKCPKIGKRYNTIHGSVRVTRSNFFRNALTVMPEQGDEIEISLDEWPDVLRQPSQGRVESGEKREPKARESRQEPQRAKGAALIILKVEMKDRSVPDRKLRGPAVPALMRGVLKDRFLTGQSRNILQRIGPDLIGQGLIVRHLINQGRNVLSRKEQGLSARNVRFHPEKNHKLKQVRKILYPLLLRTLRAQRNLMQRKIKSLLPKAAVLQGADVEESRRVHVKTKFAYIRVVRYMADNP